jgi:hypothetical protein
LTQKRLTCFQLLGILRFRKDEIEHGKVFKAIDKFFAILSDLRGKLIQDASFFIAFLQLQLTHGVVQLNDGQWFNKESGTA